jgi:hypothetical protein
VTARTLPTRPISISSSAKRRNCFGISRKSAAFGMRSAQVSCEQSREGASCTRGATLEACPTNAGTEDRKRTACQFAQALRRHAVIRTADSRHTPEALAAKRMACRYTSNESG